MANSRSGRRCNRRFALDDFSLQDRVKVVVRAEQGESQVEAAPESETTEEPSTSAADGDAVNSGSGAPSDIMALIETSSATDEEKEQLRSAAAASREETNERNAALAKAEESLKVSQERYIRLNADFDNFRKRMAGEKDQLSDRVKADTVKALLAVVDSFEMAKGTLKPDSEAEKKIDSAYQGVYKQMVEAFRSLGVETVAGVGTPFDPEVHEAIMREERDDIPDGTVLKEFRRGFRLGSQLLRAAMVQVSYTDKVPEPAASNGAAAPEEEEAAAIDTEVAEPAAQES
ncbi:g10623 [Coccomyxa elongata]